MKRTAGLALAASLAAAPTLSSCIAAAVPLAAGAVLAGTQTRGHGPDIDSPHFARASAASDLRIERTSLTQLPPPDVAPFANPAVTSFGTYALGEAELAPGASRRASALLDSSSNLKPVRSNCAAHPPAVFIDLDPGRGAFDPLAPGAPDPELARVLAELRTREVKVVWFSRLGDNFAPAVRTALAASGLDSSGTDELVLMRDLAERKQTRRDEVAARMCPVAMLGDERADFDELYLYLKQPDAALALDAILGRGWFLASPFLPPNETTPSGGTS